MGTRQLVVCALLVCVTGCSTCGDSPADPDAARDVDAAPDGPPPRLAATRSSPVVITPDGREVWAVNSDSDSISLFDVDGDANTRIAEIAVGEEPVTLALDAGGTAVYVVNRRSNSVSVIDTGTRAVVDTVVDVCTGPYGAAMTPAGDTLYVTCAGSQEIVAIDPSTHSVVQRLSVSFGSPRGIAISADSQVAVVTLFLALPASGAAPGAIEGFDDGKSGYALVLDLDEAGATVADTIELPSIATGFTADRTPFCVVNGAANDTYCGGAAEPQRAFPNLLQSAVFVGDRVYLPATGSSPEPPVRFDVNLHGLLVRVDLGATPSAIVHNLDAPVVAEPVDAGDPLNRLFFSAPWTLGVTSGDRVGYTVVSGGDVVVRTEFDEEGTPSVAAPDGRITRIPVGKMPVGIAIAPDDTRAYVLNEVSRDLTVIDLTDDTVVTTISSSALPAPGSSEETVLLGKELFHSALGPPCPDATFTGRFTMSDNGRGRCAGCHPDGLSDGVTWIFASGPRQTAPLDATFSAGAATDQRVLNWSAIRSSITDFEKNTENVSGGFGLIGAFGAADGVEDHGANRGLDPRADAIEAYVATIEAPRAIRAVSSVADGRRLFVRTCAGCHGGPNWSGPRFEYDLPAAGDPDVVITAGQIVSVDGVPVLRDVDTFDPTAPIEIRGGGASIGQIAQGADGFNAPSLLAVAAHAPYFHDGSARTLAEVLDSGHAPTLTEPDKDQLEAFLQTIDDTTPLTVAADVPVLSDHNSPIQMSPDERYVYTANADTDTMSVVSIANDENTLIAEVAVGREPRSVAAELSGESVYVLNRRDGTISVVETETWTVTQTVPDVCVEPYGLALTPDDRLLFVTCSSGVVVKLDRATLTELQTLPITSALGSVDLRGIEISDDGKTVYVSQMLAELDPAAGALGQARDIGKQGVIYKIDVDAPTAAVVDTIELPALADTGFTADRTTFCTINGAVNDTFCGVAAAPQGAFPNQLQSLLLVGDRLYVPSIGSSPEPPVRFDVNLQALISTVTLEPTPTVSTVNLNRAVPAEPIDAGDPLNKVFFSTLWDLRVKPGSTDVGFALSAGSDLAVRVTGLATGAPTIDAGGGAIIRVALGKNPRGLAINASGSRMYSYNEVGRSVTAVDISEDRAPVVLDQIQVSALPTAGSPEATVLLGQELFNSSRGLDPLIPPEHEGRFTMSDNGWGSCAGCHPYGLADGVTWSFPDGPRQTVPLDGTFANSPGEDQRILNWSATRSSVQDFEKNTEGVSGGFGLIGGFGAGDGVVDHGANRGLDPRADAIAEYVRSIRSPIATPPAAPVTAGRAVFESACASCHGGPTWSRSSFSYDLPASGDADVVLAQGQVVSVGGVPVLRDVSTFAPSGVMEIRGAGSSVGQQALGTSGYNPPSLLGGFRHDPYFHDGRCRTFNQVLLPVAVGGLGHGTGGLSAQEIADVTAFVATIDDTTAIVP